MQSPKKNWLRLFIFAMLLLIGLGVLFVLEASLVESETTFNNPYFLFQKHLTGMLIGSIAFLVGFLVPYRFWQKISIVLYLLSLILLLFVFIPGIGLELNGARRWLDLPGLNLQPVELLKFSLIAFFANWLPKHQKLGTFLLSLAVPSILILLQPDLGSLLLTLAIGFSLYFFAGGKMKNIALLGLSGIPFIILVIVISPYRLQRLTTFLNPESDPLGASFHIRQIVVALGRGGWFGQGFGNSKQKYAYIPEASTDSIFAIVGEEMGFVGSFLIIVLYFLLILSSFKIATNPKLSPSKQLFGLGITTWITIQTMLNLAAVVSLVPLTGVPLPFFSYGRSSQIMILLAAGCLTRIGKKVT